MKILITGVLGMLGSALVETLSPSFDLLGLGRHKPSQPLLCPFVQCDLSDLASTQGILLQEKPDWIFHTAGMTQVDLCEIEREEALRLNVTATKNLVEAANEINSRLIFFGTDYIFNGEKKGEYLETDLPSPLNFYGETKLLAEKYIQSHAKQYLIFRISWLFGVRNSSFPKTILKLTATQKEIKVVDDQWGRPTYVGDIAKAFLDLFSNKYDCLEKHMNQIFHLANQGTTNWSNYAKLLLKESGHSAVKVIPIKSSELTRKAKRPANGVLSLEKLHSQLGINLPPWQIALRDYLSRIQECHHDE